MSLGNMSKLQYLQGLLANEGRTGVIVGAGDGSPKRVIDTGGGGDPSAVTGGLLGNGFSGGNATKNAATGGGAAVDYSGYGGYYQYDALPKDYYSSQDDDNSSKGYNSSGERNLALQEAMKRQQQENILKTYNSILPQSAVGSYGQIPQEMLQYLQANDKGGVSANINGIIGASAQQGASALRDRANQLAQQRAQQVQQQQAQAQVQQQAPQQAQATQAVMLQSERKEDQ